MYESFFGFSAKPFDLTPNPAFIYLSRSHRKALTYLDYGIRERAGFILFTGDVGSGKTTIIRNILTKGYERVQVAKIFNTKITSEQLISMINDEFGLPTAGRDKITLLRDLNNYLIDQYARRNQPVLIIDEAQNLGMDILEEIRMLSNLETSDTKLLQIILVGQPELRSLLADPTLLQLRQRVSINCILKPLEEEEISPYIRHRMTVAGNPTAASFSEAALGMIYRHTHGIPRLVNILCDFILLAAFADETRTITEEMVADIVADLDFDHHYWGSSAPVARNAGDTPPPAGMEKSLADIAARLEQVEKLISRPLSETFMREVSYRMNSLQNAFRLHVGETESLLTELQRKYELLKKSLPPASQPDQPRTLIGRQS